MPRSRSRSCSRAPCSRHKPRSPKCLTSARSCRSRRMPPLKTTWRSAPCTTAAPRTPCHFLRVPCSCCLTPVAHSSRRCCARAHSCNSTCARHCCCEARWTRRCRARRRRCAYRRWRYPGTASARLRACARRAVRRRASSRANGCCHGAARRKPRRTRLPAARVRWRRPRRCCWVGCGERWRRRDWGSSRKLW